jgi:putative membrane protein
MTMKWILQIVMNAGVLLLLANLMKTVSIKDYRTAIITALLVGILNATVGFILRLPLNIVTLGLLTFFVRLVVSAVIIKLVDRLMKGFEVRGFWPAVIIAAALSIASGILDRMFY